MATSNRSKTGQAGTRNVQPDAIPRNICERRGKRARRVARQPKTAASLKYSMPNLACPEGKPLSSKAGCTGRRLVTAGAHYRTQHMVLG
jgi:hypothetical protein